MMTIALAACNQLNITRGVWGSLCASVADKSDAELMLIDNASTDDTVHWVETHMGRHWPRLRVIRNATNEGALPAANRAWREAAGDVVAIFHNDLYVYDLGWDRQVKAVFENPEVGLVGFGGSRGIGPNGGREGFMSNMLDAELHGVRIAGVHRAAVLDSFALIFRRSVLEKLGEIAPGYDRHHFYDKDVCMAVQQAGYKVMVAAVFCHHEGGVTWGGHEWTTIMQGEEGGERALYQRNLRRFFERWGKDLPFRV